MLAAGCLAAGAVVLTSTLTTAPPPARSVSVETLPGVNQIEDTLPSAQGSAAPILDGGVIATLTIERIGLHDAPIRDRGPNGIGGMEIAPGYGVTRFSLSAPFGRGNSVLYGHDDIQGSVFGRLSEVHSGDLIVVTTAQGQHIYQVVDRTIVSPTDVRILAPSRDVRLTLFTCWPNHVDTQRVVITALQEADNAVVSPSANPFFTNSHPFS